MQYTRPQLARVQHGPCSEVSTSRVAGVPPPWVLQESGYALKAGRNLILFREDGVEIPGLQGDLEYIPFKPTRYESAFQKASEMINKLMAGAAGIKVETIVSPAAKSVEAAEDALGTEQVEQECQERKGHRDRFWDVLKCVSEHDWQNAEEAFQQWIPVAREEEPEKVVLFQSVYYRLRLEAGDSKALDELRSLAVANPEHSAPQAALGKYHFEFEQFDEAADCYISAANHAETGDDIRYGIRASECMMRSKRFSDALDLLLSYWADADGARSETRFEILSALYDVLKQSRNVYASFAVAELALHESPAQGSFRFSLGVDYDTSGWLELFLRHYALICEKDTKNAAALHNLGLAYSKLELPINSVSRYKRALGLGETLSASALGYAYLDAGMEDEAMDLLRKAQEKDDHASEVDGCLAALQQRKEREAKQEASKLETAKEQQAYLVSFARGFLSEGIPDLDGDWGFPFGTIHLNFEGGKLIGQVLIHKPQYGAFKLAAHALLGSQQEQDERVAFTGDLSARTCKYRLTRRPEKNDETGAGEEGMGHVSLALLAGRSSSTEEGYIVFSSDGSSGSVAVVKAEKPEKYYEIKKLK